MSEDPPPIPPQVKYGRKVGRGGVRGEDHVCNQSCMGALRIFQASGIGYWPSGLS